MERKTLLTFGLGILGMIISLFLNFYVIQNILIPDPSVYDTSNIKTGFFFNLFYEVSSNTGYNADATVFNLCFTMIVGFCFGAITAYKLVWMTNNKKSIKAANSA